jgi:hypothetical protein
MKRPVPWPLVGLVGVFVASRVGYYLAGVRFDGSTLPWYMHFIDPALLRADLAQSLWYLHSQPPLFNLLLGIVVNLFPGWETVAFSICYLLLGLAFALTLFLLLRGFGTSAAVSAAASAIYITSPAVVLYENWLFYTYPVTVLLLAAALFWQRFAQQGKFTDALGLFTCGAALALTWSLFHLVWLNALAVILILARRHAWRRVLAAAAVPVLVVTFWYGKNLVQVGEFTGSTWFGMNFSRMTSLMLTGAERRTLHRNGTISGVSMVPPFSDLERYSLQAVPTGVPALDQVKKPSGRTNFNNRLYIGVSRQARSDAFRMIAAHPIVYARGLARSFSLYFLPASANPPLYGNLRHIAKLDFFYSVVLNGCLGRYHPDHMPDLTNPLRYLWQNLPEEGWVLILAYAAAVILGLASLLHPSLLPSHRLPLLFLWANVVWMTVVGNAVDCGDNNRFRFGVDPLAFVLLLVVAQRLLTRDPDSSRLPVGGS